MKLKQLGVRVPYDIFTKVKLYCAKKDLTISEFVISALQNEMENRGIK